MGAGSDQNGQGQIELAGPQEIGTQASQIDIGREFPNVNNLTDNVLSMYLFFRRA